MKYRNYTYSFIVTLLSAALILAVCPALKVATPVQAKGTVIFFDDFQGKALDRGKWNVEVTGMHVNNELQAYIDTASTLFIAQGKDAEGAGNGALVLRPQYSPDFKTRDGQQFNFVSARINSKGKFDFKYGTAEARIKLTAGEGLWPAWWMLGNGNWPETGEVDIMEYIGEKDWASAAVHGPGYSGETPFVNRQYFDAGNDVTRWHIYAVECTPESLDFKYDGKLMFRVNKKMVTHYGNWSFDNEKFLILNYALGGAYPVKLNGVKAPYYGMPVSTVELVKKNEARMLVDWVRVTKNE